MKQRGSLALATSLLRTVAARALRTGFVARSLLMGAIAGTLGVATASGQPSSCDPTFCALNTNVCATWGCRESLGCVPIDVHNGVACGDQTETVCSYPDICSNLQCRPNDKPAGTACGDQSESVCDNANVCSEGSCVANHEPSTTECRGDDPATCNPAEFCTDGECPADVPTECSFGVCRSAGFWSTHAGTEKGAFDIALETLELGGGSLAICGEVLSNTSLDSNASALEGMCDSRGGRFALARQLTALALNCISTVDMPGLGSDCSLAGPDFATSFAECNAVCVSGTGAEIDACALRLECLNSGGTPAQDNGRFLCATGTCSDNGQPCTSAKRANCAVPETASCVEDLDNCSTQLLPLSYSSAGSAKACNDARKTTCDIFDASCP